jgi:hypothetical protein
MSYDLQAAKTKQRIKDEEMQVKVSDFRTKCESVAPVLPLGVTVHFVIIVDSIFFLGRRNR